MNTQIKKFGIGQRNTVEFLEYKIKLYETYLLIILKLRKCINVSVNTNRPKFIIFENVDSADSEIEGIIDKMKSFEFMLKALINEVSQSIPRLTIKHENIIALNLKYENHLKSIHDLKKQFAIFMQRINELECFESISENRKGGVLLWEICEVHKNVNRSKLEPSHYLVSPSFLSSNYGYRFSAVLFLNGNGNCFNSHISIFIVVLEGDFDDILQWPILFEATFIVMNLVDRSNDFIDKIKVPRISESCQRPVNGKMNPPIGLKRFMPLSLLMNEKSDYIRNNKFYIKICVECDDQSYC